MRRKIVILIGVIFYTTVIIFVGCGKMGGDDVLYRFEGTVVDIDQSQKKITLSLSKENKHTSYGDDTEVELDIKDSYYKEPENKLDIKDLYVGAKIQYDVFARHPYEIYVIRSIGKGSGE